MSFPEDYTLLDKLGQGGYATVYKVRHNKLGYIRAIRVLNAIIAHGEEDKTYQKFLEECRLLLRLGNGYHPNIVHIYQPLLRAQRAILEMDYVDGLDLFHHLEKKSGYVETKEVMKLLSDIGSALAYCHENIYKFCMDKDEDSLKDAPNDGSKLLIDEQTRQRLIKKYRVIHNDIHSGNIIRREDGSFVLLDFGLAIDGDSVVRSSRRRNGAPEFKAPEKWDNEGTLTTQSDIYSFGVVLYEFLAGRVPFLFNKQNSNPIEAEYLLGKAHKEKQPESIFVLRKEAFERTHPEEGYKQDYPQWLEDVIMKCLAKNPKDRYKNGKELFDEIANYLQIDSSVEKFDPREKEKYEKKLADVNASLLSYQKSFARLQEDLTDAKCSKESLYNEVRSLTKQNAKLKSKLKELEESSSGNNEGIVDLQKELTNSKKSLESAETEILRLNKIIKKVRTQREQAYERWVRVTPRYIARIAKWKRVSFSLMIVILLTIWPLWHYISSYQLYVNEYGNHIVEIDSLKHILNTGGQTAIIEDLQQQIKDKEKVFAAYQVK